MKTQPQQIKSPQSPEEICNSYFLDIRCAILEVAAFMDRVQRADEGGNFISNNARVQQLLQAGRTSLSETEAERVKVVLELFSEE